MCRKIGYLLALAIIIFQSCSEKEEPKQLVLDQASPVMEAPVEEIPDSTAYYDSVFAPLSQKLDSFFSKKLKNRTFYGSVLYAERGHIILEKSYGFANKKKKDSLTLDHTFQLASASKPFTAVAALMLIQDGKIKLTDTIQQYIPDFPYPGIDIHQLLSHRSGMSQYTHFCDAPDSIWPDKHQTICNEDVIEIMADIEPMLFYPPNHTHYYCNTNYIILASIIEKVSGMSFEAFLQENIFDPCNMNSTVIYTRDNKDSLINPAIGHEGNFRPGFDIYLNGCVGDKGVYSNTRDLFNFDQALYDDLLLDSTHKAMLFTEHSKRKRNGKNYGYGFRLLFDENRGKIIYHTGWWYGFRSNFIRIPKTQQTVIWLSNLKRGQFLSTQDLINLLPKANEVQKDTLTVG